jgi:hypothetical protein
LALVETAQVLLLEAPLATIQYLARLLLPAAAEADHGLIQHLLALLTVEMEAPAVVAGVEMD